MWSKPLWLQVGGVAAVALALLLTGAYVQGKFEEAEQAEVLRTQIKDMTARLDKANTKAVEAEAEIQADRDALATLTRKWTRTRADKDRAPCQLDPDALGVLRGATADRAPAR